jgi:chaperonin GroES
LIEQGQKVFTAIYKRVHRGLGGEIKNVVGVNRDHLNTAQYFALNDMQGDVQPEDYEDKTLDVIPMSDPTAINDRVKMAKAQVLGTFKGDQLVNQQEIDRRMMEAANIADIDKLLDVPQPSPPPDLMAKAAQAQATANAQNAAASKSLIEAATAAYALGTTMADPNIAAEAQRMMLDGMALADTVSQSMKGGDNGGQSPDGSGAIPEMGGMAPDAGLPAIPAGPAGDVGGAMGGGQSDAAGGPGQGG